jgi:urea carboxylase
VAFLTVEKPGTQTTVQDWPGRLGLWEVGVPPSGPMDARSLRVANLLVGNPEGAAALEITLAGPSLRFSAETVIALVGAPARARVDGALEVPFDRPFAVSAGAVLKVGALKGPGLRTYLAVAGGLDVAPQLGSRATFTLGAIGEPGRPLAAGDVLEVGERREAAAAREAAPTPFESPWVLHVTAGPHGAPELLTPAGVEALLGGGAAWTVHHHSDRTGIRLVGPRIDFARPDGGEAGLHPSNIHDSAYAPGAIMLAGDAPVIVGPDGPSLGGFVVPAAVVAADLWKLGQLRPGDAVELRAIDAATAAARAARHDAAVAALGAPPAPEAVEPAARAVRPAREEAAGAPATPRPASDAPAVRYAPMGDAHLLVEYGPQTLDLALRVRIHALAEALHAAAPEGLGELTPGVRSLLIRRDPARLGEAALLRLLRELERGLPAANEVELPSRVVRLPLSWDDPAAQEAVTRYAQSVRADAPWCPSNIEFIRRINGLDSEDEVKRIVFDATYLVLGLGDVYLGAPVATPLDPAHRLVTTKYNPARTWTPENAVGIGGAYLCVYGMEGPGGYQLVGRTIPVWSTSGRAQGLADGLPWLLRPFDRIRFEPVSHDELTRLRDGFHDGATAVAIEPGTLRPAAHAGPPAPAAEAFTARRVAAFAAERAAWEQAAAPTGAPA